MDRKWGVRGLKPTLLLLGKEFGDARLWAADDRFVSFDDDRALEELLVFEQDVDHCHWITDEIRRI